MIPNSTRRRNKSHRIFGLRNFFLEEKNTANPNNKGPRRIPQLVSNVVAYCCDDDVDGVLHILT
jgi:hypothetical protein